MPPLKSASKAAPRAARKTITRTVMDRVEKAIESLAEEHKKTEKSIESIAQKTEKSMKELQKIIGDLGNRFGEFNERTLVPDLVTKFKKYGFKFGKMSERVQLDDEDHAIHAELDAFLENGTEAMVVEVKVNLKPEDIDDHQRRMEKVRAYADRHNDKRKFFGALAAAVMKKEVKRHALRQGFYVIEPTGESVKITPPVSKPPKTW